VAAGFVLLPFTRYTMRMVAGKAGVLLWKWLATLVLFNFQE
jgi:hypothetical protein